MKDAWRLHRQFQHSIGELMINKTQSEDMTVKTFLEFFQLYTTNEDFQFWFVPLEELIGGLSDFNSNNPEEIAVQAYDLRPLRISSIHYYIRILMKVLSDEVDLSNQNIPYDILVDFSNEAKSSIINLKLKTSDFFIGQND